MDPTARAPQIRQPASSSGPLPTPGSPPVAAAVSGASVLRHQSQTSDARAPQHLPPLPARDAPGIPQASAAAPSRPGTSSNDSGQERDGGPSRKRIRLSSPSSEVEEAPLDVPVAVPSDLAQGSPHGRSDSPQQPAPDQPPLLNISLERIKHILDAVRYLEPAPWNHPLWRTSLQRQELQSSGLGHPLGNTIGHNPRRLASCQAESRPGRLDAFPRTGDASQDRLALSCIHGAMFDGSRISQGPQLCRSPERLARADSTASARPIPTSNSTPSSALGGPRLEPGGAYLHSHHVHGTPFRHRQRSPTAAASSSFACNTARQQDAQWSHSPVSSGGERRLGLRRSGGLFSNLRHVSSQPTAQSPFLPYASSASRLTLFGQLSRVVHEWRHFDTPQPDTTQPTPTSTLPRPPYL